MVETSPRPEPEIEPWDRNVRIFLGAFGLIGANTKANLIIDRDNDRVMGKIWVEHVDRPVYGPVVDSQVRPVVDIAQSCRELIEISAQDLPFCVEDGSIRALGSDERFPATIKIHPDDIDPHGL